MVTGMPLDFENEIPSNSFCAELPLSQAEHEAAQAEIQELLAKRAIVPCKHDHLEFISGIFVVPKKDSDKMRGDFVPKKVQLFFMEKIIQNGNLPVHGQPSFSEMLDDVCGPHGHVPCGENFTRAHFLS